MAQMQIVWRARNAGGVWTDYILLDGQMRGPNANVGPLDSGITNLAAAVKSEVPIARAASPVMNDRGNLANRMGFSVERELSSLAAAMMFKSDYPQGIPREGKYREIYIADDGSRTFREMANAVLDAPQIIGSTGIVLIIRYCVSGGTIGTSLTPDT